MEEGKIDPSSPFYLGAGDQPGNLITHVILKGDKNYLAWSRAITLSLASRRKFVFIDGTITKPTDTKRLLDWVTVNSMLVSWIMRTMDDKVASTIPYFDEARKLWDYLAKRYRKANCPRLQQLRAAITACKQTKGMSIEEYYAALMGLFDDLNQLKPPHGCECGHCTCDVAGKYAMDKEEERLHQFLIGVDDDLYAVVRTNLLSQQPPADLDHAYETLLQEEHSRGIAKSTVGMAHEGAHVFAMQSDRGKSLVRANAVGTGNGVTPSSSSGMVASSADLKKMRRLWNRSKKNSQHKMGKQEYMIFSGSEQNYIKHGAFVLEESISLFHGKTNPIRHFSVDDLNNMNVEKLPCYGTGFCNLHQGIWGEISVLVSTLSVHRTKDVDNLLRILREIVVATQMATRNNVHKILGCCLETESPVLVYEWVPIETLQDRIMLRDQNQNKPVLEWKDRLRIAWEIAYVVSYLHTAFPRPIIHKDLKPSNVFLNQDGAAKLFDFSMSESIPEGQEFVELDIVSGPMGYLAPECCMHGRVSMSADVHSFGVFLLVLLTGKKPGYKEFFASVYNGIKNKCINKIVDPAITGNGVTTIEDLQLKAFTQLAFRCVLREEFCRPSMVEAATELKNMIKSLEGGGIYRFFQGNSENFTQNESLLLEESMRLFHGNADHIRYFSVDELNSMNVEFWHNNSNLYQGSWEGRVVLVKLPESVLEVLESPIKIQLRLIREIVVASQIATHNNVHKLLGCCLETKFPVLVYEWVAAETLKDRILLKDENRNKLPLLEWKDRLRIAWEISYAVSYFHTAFQRPIIHGYLEPNSIFLDKDNTVKLSNFTLSVSIPEGQDFVVDCFKKETMEYKAPECRNHRNYTESPMTETGDEDNAVKLSDFRHSVSITESEEDMFPDIPDRLIECLGRVSVSADVYAFGVLLLVLLTGKAALFSPTGEGDANILLVNWVINGIRDKCILEIVDPTITIDGVATTEVSAAIELALKCTATEEDSRPTMVDVATELKNMIRSSESITSSAGL